MSRDAHDGVERSVRSWGTHDVILNSACAVTEHLFTLELPCASGLAGLTAFCRQPYLWQSAYSPSPSPIASKKARCVFHHDIGGTESSWDLQPALPEGITVIRAPSLRVTSRYFNICGNASQSERNGAASSVSAVSHNLKRTQPARRGPQRTTLTELPFKFY